MRDRQLKDFQLGPAGRAESSWFRQDQSKQPLSDDHGAGDAISRVARWVRLHVIWLGVYH